MDPVGMLAQSARTLTIAKSLMASAITLTLYDYLLALDDEIRYVWRGRKTWVSYFYLLTRILLTGYQFFEIYYISSPRKSQTACLAEYYIKVVLFPFFLFSSDVFITLRVYAVTSKNKILAVYFGALVLVRLVVPLVRSFVKPPVVVNFPPIPIDVFDLCTVAVDLHFMLIPISIGAAFELSAFFIIVRYTYRNRGTLKFSALIRAMITEATIYFLAMIALQMYVQLSLIFMKGVNQQLSFLAYGIFNPILGMRFAVSLRRSADPNAERRWQSDHFSSVMFAGRPPPDSQASAAHENIELDLFGPSKDQRQAWGP